MTDPITLGIAALILLVVLIAIRMPIGLRLNSSSSLMGKPLVTRGHDNSYQDKY